MADSTNPYASTSQSSPFKTNRKSLALAFVAGACLLTVITRVVDTQLANLSCMAALALFCGTLIRHPVGMLLPLTVRVATDCIVHWKTGYGFFPSWPFDYSAYVLIYVVGLLIVARPKRNSWVRVFTILGCGVSSVAIYFALSNFGVWLLWPDTYARSLAGLTECFVNAIPFARGTVLGNLIAVPLFYGSWSLVTSLKPKVNSEAAIASEA